MAWARGSVTSAGLRSLIVFVRLANSSPGPLVMASSSPIRMAPAATLTDTGDAEAHGAFSLLPTDTDAGDMIDRVETPIGPDETYGELLERLGDLGAELLSGTVRRMEAGPVEAVPQDASQATYAPMLTKELSPIDWSQSPQQIHNHVRGMVPWPVATTVLEGKKLKIFRVGLTDLHTDKAPGTPVAVTKQGLQMACGQGEVVTILELQAEGGKRMRAADYLRGHPITIA